MSAFVASSYYPQSIRCSADGNSTSTRSVRLRARVSYDGSKYNGWQFQEGCPTVQATLEKNFCVKFGPNIRAVAASRTDTGVHARGQAIHFDVPYEKAPCNETQISKLEFTLNQMLPQDVRIRSIGVAPLIKAIPSDCSSFKNPCDDSVERPWHSIYNSKGKLYSYRISTGNVFDPLERLYRHHEWRAARFGFSEDLLRDTAKKFTGSHDFSAFTNSARMPAGITAPIFVNPIRTVRKIDVLCEGNGCYRLDFHIDGATYRMIRNIMGTILEVACGKTNIGVIDELFVLKKRSLVPKAAPANGLCLEEVFYDDWDR